MARRITIKMVAMMALITTGTALAAQAGLTDRETELAAASQRPYVKENLASFRSFALSNGIPVVVKLNAANRIYNLRLVLRGGAGLTPPDQAGVEDLMLQTMARGSRAYPYEKLTAILDATSSGMGAESSFDASSYSLNTLDKYFETVFPVWAATVADPAFAEADFRQVKENALKALEAHDQDPWSKLSREVNRRFFGDHPYGVPFDGSLETVGRLDLAAVKARYQSHFGADRMLVVAVGNFDLAKLRAELEASLGKLPAKKIALPAVGPIKGGTAAPGGLFKVEYPPAQGIAYLRGDFAGPAPADPDWMAAQIGMKMYSDLLFAVVRTKYSAVYSPGAYLRGNRANYGSVTLFKTKEPDKIKAYADEALRPLLDGQCLASGGASSGGEHGQGGKAGEFKLESLDQGLPSYQAQFVNDLYESQQTNAGIAAAIQSSLLNFGDYRYYLLNQDLIKAVKPDQVKRIMTELLTKRKLTWGVLGSAEVLQKVDPAPFR